MNFLSIKSFSKPFPYIGSTKEHIFIGLFFGVFVFIFLAIFKPFELDEIENHKYLYILGYGFITFCTLVISLGIFNYAFSQDVRDNWSIGKMILLILTETLLIGIMNLIYSYYAGLYIEGVESPWTYIFYTIAVGSIPIAFFIIFLEKRLEQRNQKTASQVFDTIESNKKILHNDYVTIFSNNQSLNIVLDHLLCIKAFGNYVEVFHVKDGVLKKELLRKPLSQISEELNAHQSLKQCHRSYVVNFDKIEKVTGNARNFNLHLPDLDFTIPVSRSFPTTLIKNIKKAS